MGGGRASGRQIAEAEDDHGLGAILQTWLRTERPACGEDTTESLRGAGVGEIEMLQNFGCAPFSRGMPGELFGGKAIDGGGDGALQSGKMRVHRRY